MNPKKEGTTLYAVLTSLGIWAVACGTQVVNVNSIQKIDAYPTPDTWKSPMPTGKFFRSEKVKLSDIKENTQTQVNRIFGGNIVDARVFEITDNTLPGYTLATENVHEVDFSISTLNNGKIIVSFLDDQRQVNMCEIGQKTVVSKVGEVVSEYYLKLHDNSGNQLLNPDGTPNEPVFMAYSYGMIGQPLDFEHLPEDQLQKLAMDQVAKGNVDWFLYGNLFKSVPNGIAWEKNTTDVNDVNKETANLENDFLLGIVPKSNVVEFGQIEPTAVAPPDETQVINVTPTSASSPTPEPATAIPTKTITELGITDANIINAFSGATFKQEVDGSYSVSAISYNGETKVTANYTIDKATLSLNPDIKNAYAPATVSATDSQGNKITLIWDGEHGAWRVPFAMIDNSDFSKTSQIPFVAEGDQKIAVESALLYLKDHPPFTDAAVESYKKYGGNSLLFEYFADQGKDVKLKSKGNDNPNWTPDNATMKATHFWFYHKINGVRQDGPLVVLLDPADPKNPKANEYKVISALDDYFKLDMNNLTTKQKSDLIDAFYGQKLLTPYLALYGDAQYLKSHPLDAYLLDLQGKLDLDTIISTHINELGSGSEGKQPELEYLVAHLDNKGNIVYDQLQPEIQIKLLPIIFGVHK
jgi:hypothetical protein